MIGSFSLLVKIAFINTVQPNNFFWTLKHRKPLWRPQQMWPSNFMTPDHLIQDSLLISSIPARELDSFEMEGNELAIRRSFWGLDWDILLGHLQNIFEATVRQLRFYPGPHAVLWNQTWLKWFSPPSFQITSFWGIYFKNGVLMQTWLKYLPENLSL